VDHFSFAVQDTFKLRYLVNDTWQKAQDAPIFFYTGNEGSIEVFAENTVRAVSWRDNWYAISRYLFN